MKAKREKGTKLYHHLKKWLEKAVMDFGMITQGDRVLVAFSGGADSFVLLHLLSRPMVFVPFFELACVHVDMGFPGSDQDRVSIEEYLRSLDIPYAIHATDFGPLAHSEINRKNPCFLCSRLRRKKIFETAEEMGCNKIALAHHRDDIIETLLINLFYGREISTMVPVQSIFRGRYHIIRPLAYIPEALVKKYAREQGFPILPDRCPSSTSSRRYYIKQLISRLEEENKEIRHNIWTAMFHVKPDYLLKNGG
ncbi:MAG: tRNA 2-thiocytidine(32) synthetase TtcA [Syntrophales bacterium]|nr:tRNA 2-thiocytidine(32) synthetase TtcA [Syntrophales bacterium]